MKIKRINIINHQTIYIKGNCLYLTAVHKVVLPRNSKNSLYLVESKANSLHK